MAKAWCPGCQRGNSYDDRGICHDCGMEIAQPYKYKDMNNKEQEILENSFEKGETLSNEEAQELVDKGEVEIPEESIVKPKKRRRRKKTKVLE